MLTGIVSYWKVGLVKQKIRNSPKRGARDAILFCVLTWLAAMAAGRRVAVYCADVSGAFDKVHAGRLLGKLRACGVAEGVLRFLASWLQPRTARVVANGSMPDVVDMHNMVYQGTAWGPPFWNSYYADVRDAISISKFSRFYLATISTHSAFWIQKRTIPALSDRFGTARPRCTAGETRTVPRWMARKRAPISLAVLVLGAVVPHSGR